MQVVVDTNIVYYLSGISNSPTFLLPKFQKDNHEIVISFFTFLEILEKQNLKQKKQALSFLEKNCKMIIETHKLKDFMYNKPFQKCLTKSKSLYYKNTLKEFTKPYFVDLLSSFSLMTGIMYLAILNELDGFGSTEILSKSKRYFQRVEKDIRDTTESYYDDIFIKNLKHSKKQYKKEVERAEEKLLIDIMHVCVLVYETYKTLDTENEDFEFKFEELKKDVFKRKISVDELKNSFDKIKRYPKFKIKFNKLYNQLFEQKDTFMLDILIYMTQKFFQDKKLDYNDLSDFLNLKVYYECNNLKQSKFLSDDKDVKNFLKEYKDKYTDMFLFMKNYVIFPK